MFVARVPAGARDLDHDYNVHGYQRFGPFAAEYSRNASFYLMNKAFVREPEFDGKAYCPLCGALGAPVTAATVAHHVPESALARLSDAVWFCGFAKCKLAYFDLFDSSVTADELRAPVYPKDAGAPLCACFGFTLEDLEADLLEGTPTRVRELLAKSKSDAANCRLLAADGQCCMREVQRLYMSRLGERR